MYDGNATDQTATANRVFPYNSTAAHPTDGGRGLLDVLGDLVQTTAGKWITHAPSRRPNGQLRTHCGRAQKKAPTLPVRASYLR
jgi:hypothetical protein